jgi:hypothetical protein
MQPHYGVRKVFIEVKERVLANYIGTVSKMCYGLLTTKLLQLAFEVAFRLQHHGNNLHVLGWNGCEDLCITVTISVSGDPRHVVCQDKHILTNVTKTFFENLKTVMARWLQVADGSWIFNLDETVASTVQKPGEVTAHKGVKQLNHCTSGEGNNWSQLLRRSERNFLTSCNDFS